MSAKTLLKLAALAGIAGAMATAWTRRPGPWGSWEEDGEPGGWRARVNLRRWSPGGRCTCGCEELADTVRGLEQEVAWLRRELEAVES